MAYNQENLYFSVSTPLGPDKLLLKSFDGEEAISKLFRFRLEMQSESYDLDFKQIVGKSVTISVLLADETTRYINGIVGRFVQAGSEEGFANYIAEIFPKFWLLTMASDCKIFQQQSVPDIIEAVFADLGLTEFRNSLTGTYQAREYCVQYNESAFDFLSRLMEDEGIFYFFEHEDGKHTLVLADDSGAFKACTGGEQLEYQTHGLWTQQNIVQRCTFEENVIPGQVVLDDFNFETPSTDLVASTDSTVAIEGSKRSLFEYPAGFLKKDAGESRAKLRIEAFEAPKIKLIGESYCRPFVTGGKFTLSEHYRNDVNAEYVLQKVIHQGTWHGYSNHFEAFPSDIPFHPPRVTAKPRIPSTQTATVVGKSGEEIWTDKYGRIKVQFHWDRIGKKDENSSCWIRVAHGWAGKTWGQFFLPRIDQEVVVSFLEGDPDHPLVTGGVYNAEQTVPYALPGEQTKSTIKSNSSKGGGGYNELRFEDKKDQEEIYFQAEKDSNRVVKNNDTLKVGFEKKEAGDQTIDIYNHRTVTIDQGNDSLEVKTGNRIIKVSTANETHEVKGTRDLTVTGAETHQNKDNFDHTVDKDYTLKILGNLVIDVTGTVSFKAGKTMALESGQNMTQTSGASLIAKAKQSLTNTAGTALSNQAGTALNNQAGTELTNQAGTNLTNRASVAMTNQASATQTVDGGGMLTVKGGLVKIN